MSEFLTHVNLDDFGGFANIFGSESDPAKKKVFLRYLKTIKPSQLEKLIAQMPVVMIHLQESTRQVSYNLFDQLHYSLNSGDSKGIEKALETCISFINHVNLTANELDLKEKENLEVVKWQVEAVKQKQKAEEQRDINYELATRDTLTKIHNRRYFEQTFESSIKRVNKYDSDISLILIDINDFKQINDTLGHPTGDYVLETLAKYIQANIRPDSDLVARWGGDEFSLILPSTTEEQAELLAENLRKGIERYDFEHDGKKIDVRISCGVKQIQKDENSKDCFKSVDDCLYFAKQLGKNCSVSATFYNYCIENNLIDEGEK